LFDNNSKFTHIRIEFFLKVRQIL